MSKLATQRSINIFKVGDKGELNKVDFFKEIGNKKVILKLFRRFGCPLCRLEAKNLNSYKPLFDKLDVSLIGVGFDKEGLEDFQKGNFWNAKLYLDSERELYKLFNTSRVSVWNGLMAFTSPVTLNSLMQAKEDAVGGNYTKGDGFQLGGTIILDTKGNVLYKFLQQRGNDYPNIKEIIHLLGGDVNLVNDSNLPHWPEMDKIKFSKL